MAVGFSTVQDIPKLTRASGARKYAAAVQHVRDSQSIVQIDEDFTNAQVAARINDQFGEEFGIKAVARRNGNEQPAIDRETKEPKTDENGNPVMKPLYSVFIAPLDYFEDEDHEDEDDSDDEDDE